MNKKITFCTYDAPSFFGPNTSLNRLLPGLKANNFTIEVLLFYEGPLDKCETYNHLLQSEILVKTHPHLSTTEEKINWILQTLSDDPPDVFIPYLLLPAMYAARWLKASGIPTVGCLHSDDEFYDGVIDFFVRGEKSYQFTAVVSCSHYLHNKVNRLNIAGVVSRFIPYGVPVKVPIASFDQEEFRLVYVGRLVEKQKRISDVVKALAKASNLSADVSGVIYGNGDQKKIARLINKYSKNNKVGYGGVVDNKVIFEKLSECQAFVLLSDYEGLPQTLLEAMSCGLIPICFDMKSGVPELVEQNHTGVIVSDRDKSFTNAVDKLKKDKELCLRLSQNARQKIIQSYSIENNIEMWTALLHDLTQNQQLRKKLFVPAGLNLPKPHPYLKKEDYRTLNRGQLILKKIEDSIIIKQTKKILKTILGK